MEPEQCAAWVPRPVAHSSARVHQSGQLNPFFIRSALQRLRFLAWLPSTPAFEPGTPVFSCTLLPHLLSTSCQSPPLVSSGPSMALEFAHLPILLSPLLESPPPAHPGLCPTTDHTQWHGGAVSLLNPCSRRPQPFAGPPAVLSAPSKSLSWLSGLSRSRPRPLTG